MHTGAKPSTRTKQILKGIHGLAWILFIGVCIRTGALLYSLILSLCFNPAGAKNLYPGLDLSALYQFNSLLYAILVFLVVFLSGLKGYLLYLVIKIFTKISLVHPFSKEVSLSITGISYVALAIGTLTLAAIGYCDWLFRDGAPVSPLFRFLGGSTEFLLLGGIIFMIAQVFERGIEIQTENELTI